MTLSGNYSAKNWHGLKSIASYLSKFAITLGLLLLYLYSCPSTKFAILNNKL